MESGVQLACIDSHVLFAPVFGHDAESSTERRQK